MKVALGTLLLCWGCRHNIPQAGPPKNKYMFCQFWRSKFKIKVLAGLVSSEAHRGGF